MDLSMEENIIRVPLTAGKGSGHQNNALKNCPETLAKVTHFTGAIVEHTHVTIFASRSSARLSRAGGGCIGTYANRSKRQNCVSRPHDLAQGKRLYAGRLKGCMQLEDGRQGVNSGLGCKAISVPYQTHGPWASQQASCHINFIIVYGSAKSSFQSGLSPRISKQELQCLAHSQYSTQVHITVVSHV